MNYIHEVKTIEVEPFDKDIIEEESEMMIYSVSETGNTHFAKGEIKLNPQNGDIEEQHLEKYAFSNAIAASVKLGMLESKLDRIIDSIEYVTDDLKQSGKIQMTRNEVLMKTGEIYSLTHVINLSSDLLDTPDFYWDREKLENLYNQTCAHLTMSKRTRIMNEKLSHCVDLMDLLTTHLNDKHHTKLEWYIIALIMIEVVFELWHFVERYIH